MISRAAIGVTLGETHEKWTRKTGGWTIRTCKGLPELVMGLNAGRIDAVWLTTSRCLP